MYENRTQIIIMTHKFTKNIPNTIHISHDTSFIAITVLISCCVIYSILLVNGRNRAHKLCPANFQKKKTNFDIILRQMCHHLAV